MYKAHKRVEEINTANGFKWEERCFRLPVLMINEMPADKQRKRLTKRGLLDFDDDFFEGAMDDFESEFDDSFRDIVDNNVGVGNSIDPSTLFYPEPYCATVEKMPTACFEESLLEMFAVNGKYNDSIFESLTQEQLITAINNVQKSGIFLIERDFQRFLGGIELNSTGHIVGAKATFINWFSEANITTSNIEGHSEPERQGMGLDENVN